MAADYKQLWDNVLMSVLADLRAAGKEEEFATWFKPLTFEEYREETSQLVLQLPARTHRDYIEKNYFNIFATAVVKNFGRQVKLSYKILVDKQNNKAVVEGNDKEFITPRKPSQAVRSNLPEVDPMLDEHLNFRNYIEGESNKLSRSVGIRIAEHPRTTQFNPLFVYGPSGCGKTHLINAIGLRSKEMYPELRVLYVSARTFQQQYTTAVVENNLNNFIAFYQTLDMLIVDDIQEWISAEKTQDTFFHIFDYLFRRQKRIILACDRSPSQMKGMHERLITRFVCGVTCEVHKPNAKLCMDILKNKIYRDGLTGLFPDDVLQYVAETVNGSVRDLQGVINSLMVYSISGSTDINMQLAERVVKRIIRVSEDEPITLDIIMDTVCEHMNVTPQDINGKSRKKDIALARQIVMYLAQKRTNMPASRLGRLIGGRDHSTVLHSQKKIEKELKTNKSVKNIVSSVEKDLKSRKA